MTPISKNMYVDKLDDLINKYNNKYHKRIKMNSADVKSNTYINSNKELMIKILHLRLVILLKSENIRIFLQKTVFQIGLKKFL